MKAYIISMINDHESTVATRRLVKSIEDTGSILDVTIMQATTPDTIERDLAMVNKIFKDGTGDFSKLKYTYPKTEFDTRFDILSGLQLTGYRSNDWRKVFACLISHMRAWRTCIQWQKPIVILEHDALFTRKFDYQEVKEQFTGGVLGLNNPMRATRKANIFHQQLVGSVTTKGTTVVKCPMVDNANVPQGLAGNSAYIIKPYAAVQLFKRLQDFGGWPNDALMCNQLFPWLQVVYPYYTQVQGTASSTTS